MSTGTQIDVVMPQMGVSVSEGTVTKWLKLPGETIALDEPLLEISTDKVDTEVPSPGAGILGQILVQEGETVDVGTRLAVIVPAGTVPATAPAAPAPAEPVERAPIEAVPTPVPTAAVAAATVAPASVQSAPAGTNGGFISPVVARIASEHGIDPRVVPGTGQGGRVTKKDILAYIEAGPPAPIAATAPSAPEPAPAPVMPPAPEPAVTMPPPAAAETPTAPPAAPAAPPPPPVDLPPPAPVAAPPLVQAPQPPPVAPPPVVAPQPPPAPPAAAPAPAPTGPALLPGEAVEPVTAMRRAIAEHMRRSLDTSAHVTTVNEVDFTRIANIRRQLKPEFEKQGVGLTFMAFIGRAVVDTLAEWPWMNAELRGDSIVTRSHVNLGIAVALDGGKGLIVPVIRNAQDLNLRGMARAVQDVASRAREKKLLPDDLVGGTITITNPGGYGALFGTPIISQPQSANIGVYAIVKRPVVVTDEHGADSIAIRQMMFMSVTYDHRLIDGAYGAQFARAVKDRLERWDETS